jgi:glutaredoxin
MPERAARTVTLYTRRACGLCDEAAAELRALSAELSFAYIEVDIDSDPGLRARFNDIIPVVSVDGRIVAEAPIAAGSLRAALAAAVG